MNATDAGRLAKAEGHEYERDLPAYLNEIFGGDHVTDGRPSTKVDVYDNASGIAYSVKNVSKNHTQVALLSSRKFKGDKLFHLQMKGSGKKYNSGYHGMMFHIYQ
jgi:hypothetical protein